MIGCDKLQLERALACGRVPGAARQSGGGNPGRGGKARSGHRWGSAAAPTCIGSHNWEIYF